MPDEGYDEGWTTNTLKVHLLSLLEKQAEEFQTLVDERHRGYEQRYVAQQEAVTAALRTAQEAVTAALNAAKEAVLKAEVATEKRFEAVNEFRAQLADQARELMPRAETEIRLTNMGESITSLTSRLDRGEGGDVGVQSQRDRLLATVFAIATVASVVAAILIAVFKK
jgi:prenyltransferase beta subunit